MLESMIQEEFRNCSWLLASFVLPFQPMRFTDTSHSLFFDKIQAQIDLSKLCSCQLLDLATTIEKVAGGNKEVVLGLVYMESLIQGIIYTHDYDNYWDYLKVIGNRKVTMIYHGSYEVQFRSMLSIPHSTSSFEQRKLEAGLTNVAESIFIGWAQEYHRNFSSAAVGKLKIGIENDPDIKRLLIDCPFLKVPIDKIFFRRSR